MDQLAYPTFELAVEQAVKLLGESSPLDPSVLKRMVERGDIINRQSKHPVGDVTAGMSEAHLKIVSYVIRNDFLFSLENFLDLLKHATNFSVSLLSLFSPTGIPVGIKGIVDVMHGLAATYRRIVAAGYQLNSEEFAVFATLKDMGQGSVSEIVNRMIGVEAEFVERTLVKYQHAEAKKNGFFECGGNGVWQLIAV